MKETLFTPWSLARVAKAVEWEDELVLAKDGSSNQGKYMEALAILYERWMRDWQLPDFERSILAIHKKDFVALFKQILSTMEERIFQFGGFFRGLWLGANPTWKAATWPPLPAIPAPVTEIQEVTNRLEGFFTFLLELAASLKEETYGGRNAG